MQGVPQGFLWVVAQAGALLPVQPGLVQRQVRGLAWMLWHEAGMPGVGQLWGLPAQL